VAVSQPTASAFAPIHDMQQRILLAAIIITILVVFLTSWMLRHLLSPMIAARKYLATPLKTNHPQLLPITHQDEIGELIGAFNQLLETLGQRDEALRANRKQLSDIIKFLPTATLAIDKEGRVIIWNEAIEQMTGIPSAEILGKNGYAHSIPFYGEGRPQLLDLILEDNNEIVSRYPNIIRKGDTLSAEVFCTNLYNNKGAWIFAKAAPLHDQDGNIVGAIESVRDITERKLAETYGDIGREVLHVLNEPGDLRNAIQRVLAILKTRTGFDAVGIRLQEGEDYPYFVQDGFASDFLLKENSLMARTADGGICRDQDGNVRLECICGLVVSGRTEPTHPLFTPGGSCWTNDSNQLLEIPSSDDPRLNPRNLCVHYNYASIALVPIRDQERIIGLIQFNDHSRGALSRSMIEHLEGLAIHLGAALIRKQTEEETKALQSQLLQAQKMEAIGTLAGGIAHDFNNILGAIFGYTEIAIDCIPPESIAIKHLGKVLKASERAATLVKQILAFSRQANIEQIPLKPSHIVKEALDLLRPSLPSTITIHQEIDTATRSILADPTQVHQILMNLCTNAFHAMEQTGGTLKITLKDCVLSQEDLQYKPGIQPGTFVLLSVSDTGPGIPLEIRNNIFDPYFTTKEAGKGTGMGLAITLGIITSYGGFITCESEIGQGTVFEIFFPAIDQKIVSEIKPVEVAPPGTEHILLVDDEELLADLGTALLERLGYTVSMRTSSLDALALFQEHPEQFDAVITDQTMPDMTGIDLARLMLQIRPNLPIILCTGYSNLITEEEAKACGVKGFAMKPFAKKELASLLREVLDDKIMA
jgi:PAS domain S-box-containing protein